MDAKKALCRAVQNGKFDLQTRWATREKQDVLRFEYFSGEFGEFGKFAVPMVFFSSSVS